MPPPNQTELAQKVLVNSYNSKKVLFKKVLSPQPPPSTDYLPIASNITLGCIRLKIYILWPMHPNLIAIRLGSYCVYH